MSVNRMSRNNGFVLITTMFLLVVLAAIIGAYTQLTRIEYSTVRSSRDSANGFNAAEGGLNLRAQAIRSEFLGYNRPSGTSPDSMNACTGGNVGSGDFACETHPIGRYSVATYVIESPDNPSIITIPPGERYQNLNAQEYEFTVNSVARNPQGDVAAILELHFKSRLVPLFQFAAFYNKDLEILPGPNMNLAGPVHTNGDLYLNSDNNTLSIDGQVTVAGDLYRGRKNDSTCKGTVRVKDPVNYRNLVSPCSARTAIAADDVGAWNNMIQIGVPIVTVPEPEDLDPQPGKVYWDKADIRVVLRLNGSNVPQAIEVRDTDDDVLGTATNTLSACPGTLSGNLGSNKVVNTTNTFYNNREGKFIRMLEVNMRQFLDCLHNNSVTLLNGKTLNDDTEGGLVFHFSVDGPNSASQASPYGVRIRNGEQLQSTNGAAPRVRGLTVVSDGAIYIQGNYNSTNKIPAAALVDSFNVLSGNWNDANSTQALGNRQPNATTQNLAVLSGTDTTGGTEGEGGQGGAYNGGLENYPRFHENWSNGSIAYTYRGSFVSLNRPRHVAGAWVYGGSQYTAPVRNWNYDTAFNAAQNLPPITPRFVYLKQQLFVRDFEQDE